MFIYIPSRARSGLVRTWAHIPPGWRKSAVLVVPTKEVKLYEGYGYPAVGCPAEGIGPTRQWIVETHKKKHGRIALMLDDDLDFFVRRKDDPTKVVRANHNSIDKMLTLIAMQKAAHGGVSTREGCNRDTDDFVFNSRCLRALYYNVDIMRKYNVRFDRVPVMEDFDVALQLLRLGYDSVKINHWVQDQPGSNTRGGCSEYRTGEVQAAGANGLKKLHPDFVEVVEKPPLKSGGWNGQPRVDVKIKWKQARKSADV